MSSTSVARKYQPFKVAPSNGYIQDAPVPAEVKIHEKGKVSTGVIHSVAANYVLITPCTYYTKKNFNKMLIIDHLLLNCLVNLFFVI